jgi:hypothetical protein
MIRIWLSFSILAVFAVGLQACAPKSSGPEAPCNFVENSEGQRVSWGSSLPVVLWVDSAVPQQYYAAIQAAADTWNHDIGREVIKIGGWTTTDGVPAQDGRNVIYYLNTWEANQPYEQARTTVYWAGDRVYEADIRIDALNFQFFTGAPVANQVDMQSLMLHEMGHVLGQVHTTNPQSVMVKTLASATLRRDLSSFDENSIRCEY